MNNMQLAGKHAIHSDRPAPTFFEGALLGNGGMGAVVTTRPDAVVIHFGHNNVWDIRIAENNRERIGTFADLFARLQEIPSHYESLSDDPWYKEYVAMAGENYDFPYPRPMPCGSLLLGFDRRTTEVLGHTLRLENGRCEIRLLIDGREATLDVFADPRADRLWIALRNTESGEPELSPFNRIRLLPDPYTPQELPAYEGAVDERAGQISFRQRLPSDVEGRSGSAKDKAFRLAVRLPAGAAFRAGERELEATLGREIGFVACVQLDEGKDSAVTGAKETIAIPSREAFDAAFAAARDDWERFWSRSGVALEDEFLERIWYRNLYFFHCSVKPGATCPGLFANWSYGRIGSEWHGDYHMNYNTQQPFWVAFSSNHVDKHLTYVDMVDRVLPVSRKWAREYYGLRGAYFPHSAYPVEMSMMPYPVPHWGWEICETPWTVQSLWWHYLYTMDKKFLAERAFEPIKDAALFMVDYMKRPEARGPQWGDDNYHIYPTVVPELYELTPGFGRNRDCIVDLTLTKFLFRAFEGACEALGLKEEETELLSEVREIAARFPAYPTARSERGTVFVSVPGEDPEVVYNVPNGIATVFPGEDHGLHSPPEQYRVAVNSYLNHRNEGGNELVFLNLAGARLGKLDLERFKRQIEYCLLPNGTCTDKLLEAGGRYADTTPFDYMAPMGVWFENFALPAVVNECLMQSYNGIVRLFPNWPADKRAEFRTLRAVGGFLVSSVWEDGQVRELEMVSEAGSLLEVYNPWSGAAVTCLREGSEPIKLEGDILRTETKAGERLRLVPVADVGSIC